MNKIMNKIHRALFDWVVQGYVKVSWTSLEPRHGKPEINIYIGRLHATINAKFINDDQDIKYKFLSGFHEFSNKLDTQSEEDTNA